MYQFLQIITITKSSWKRHCTHAATRTKSMSFLYQKLACRFKKFVLSQSSPFFISPTDSFTSRDSFSNSSQRSPECSGLSFRYRRCPFSFEKYSFVNQNCMHSYCACSLCNCVYLPGNRACLHSCRTSSRSDCTSLLSC